MLCGGKDLTFLSPVDYAVTLKLSNCQSSVGVHVHTDPMHQAPLCFMGSYREVQHLCRCNGYWWEEQPAASSVSLSLYIKIQLPRLPPPTVFTKEMLKWFVEILSKSISVPLCRVQSRVTQRSSASPQVTQKTPKKARIRTQSPSFRA